MPWVERASYLERLHSVEGTGDIKVITGVRRSGKSELMKAFSAELKKRDPLSNSLYIDLLDLDNEELLEYHALHDRIAKSHKDGVRNRLFIDEVQRCEGFERVINSIHARGGWDIYLTGSNAFLLSSDLATLFTPTGIPALRRLGAGSTMTSAFIQQEPGRGSILPSSARKNVTSGTMMTESVYIPSVVSLLRA